MYAVYWNSLTFPNRCNRSIKFMFICLTMDIPWVLYRVTQFWTYTHVLSLYILVLPFVQTEPSCEYFITLYALRAQYVCFRNECITYHVKCETTYILVFAKCIGLTSCLICRRLKHGARYVCRLLELVNFPKQMHPFD